MGLFRKGSKAYSIFQFKCPRCHVGDLFETGTWSFQKSFDMPKRCPVCKQSYMPEPGFYYGAMFISYAITGWFALGFVGFCIVFLEMGVYSSFALLIFIFAVFFVWIFRISRAIWININVKYRADAIQQIEEVNK
ncbi:MAG: DUF983 domain-containing protein [Bacteroidota bacterium]